MDDEYVRRTAITRLVVSDEQQSLLEATISEYLTGAQLATDMAWPNVSTKDKLQPLAYDPIREQTDLSSQHAILATHQAAEAISGCLERKDKGLKASKPAYTSPTITYDTRTMTLFDDHTVSLTTVGSRIRCPLALPQDDDGYQWHFLTDERWELTESTLTARNGNYFLHIDFRRHKTDAERTAEQRTAENGTVLGVDLGVENIAVTSTGTFVSGGELAHRQNEYEQRRASLQQCGTRWAHENMQSVGRKEDGRFTILIHEAANTILAEARENDCTHIAFEDLDDIRERLPDTTWQHRWAFRKIVEIVTYKAKSHGIRVEQVNPRNTSVEGRGTVVPGKKARGHAESPFTRTHGSG